MKHLNTNIFRTLALAIMAVVCTTGKAQDFSAGDPATDPLAAWYYGTDTYVLRTIDDDHKVIDAMKKLQEVNSHETLTWDKYNSCSFYLIEDVDFTDWQDNSGNTTWIPLGTSSNPFCSSFYCYAPSWDYFSGPTSSIGAYPKNTSESPAAEKDWAAGYKFTYNISDIDLSSYEESIDNFISSNLGDYYYDKTEDEISVYATMDGSSYFVDNVNNTLVPAVEGNCYTYDISKIDLGESSIDDFISESLSSYFVVKDAENNTITIYATEAPTDITYQDGDGNDLTPTNTPGTLKYRLLPVVNGNPGYFYENYIDESSYDQKYYTTDNHLGTVKIKNMTVSGAYDYAGFFGYIGSSSLYFNGFTFENCSVTTTKENGYAGMLMGYDEGSYITDLFIGTSSSPCTVTAESENHAGAVLGYAGSTSTSIGATGVSSKEFDKDISSSYCTEEGGDGYSLNKIYCTVTNGTDNYYSAYYYDDAASEAYGYEPSVYHTWYSGAIEKTYAFGSKGNDEEGNPLYGTGTLEDDPFIISSVDHLKNLINIVNNAKYSSYRDFAGAESPASETYYYKQTADIAFSEALTAGIGTSTCPFYCEYDGDGHTITVDVTNYSDYAALFAYTNGAEIKNLSIEGTNTGQYAAGIIGTNSTNTSTLTNCIVNVTLSATNRNGLVYYGDVTITDCFNKATPELGFTSSSSDTETSCFYTNKAKGITDDTADNETSTTGEGTEVSPLKISSLDDLKILPEYGLYYQLADNIFETETKLVDPAGGSLLPESATNNNYIVEKFCGTVDGNYHLIAGITDKALFGTIVGNTEIKNIGFVNCYNASNKKVNLANSVTSGTLTVDQCYGDGYFDFGSATKTDCYSYKCNANAPVMDFEEKTNENNWEQETFEDKGNAGRYILKKHKISIPYTAGLETFYYYTDAISIAPSDNTIMAATDDRLRYKYNIAVSNVVDNLYLLDFMDFYDPSALTEEHDYTYWKTFQENIEKTGFSVDDNTTANNIYYCRKRHNDWESVCLPFAFKMSDIENSSNFEAYTYSEKNENGANFTKLEDDVTIAAGQPVLILNKDKANYDLVIKLSNPSGIALTSSPDDDENFKGALHTNKSCSGKYKIDGTKTANGGGTLLQCDENSWIYPFRTYLDFGSGLGAKAITFFIDDDDTPTDVAKVAAEIMTLHTGDIYTLDGRKLSANGTNGLKPGMYIVNGKKIVVK